MPPGLGAEAAGQGLEGLLGGLLGGEAGPVVVARTCGVPRMGEVMQGLAEPVSRALGHVIPLFGGAVYVEKPSEGLRQEFSSPEKGEAVRR